ncbi:MAG: Formylmethanofuran dehydrogenase associated protein FmdE / Molybdopterin molybdenumtransferase (EC 2.10.1.1) [Olavius algarvensis Delta 4 endosymbiont]|nr:MAG: Formylmethanofuran dehydrogenase associated protein FmdE / Molybdopterin molybdenumtransferase (EC 2.10.1.1) [Olavius algarvensis Delta 4 endosymbiont]
MSVHHYFCGLALPDFLVRMEAFHGYRSPGILLGGCMLDAALDKLAATPYLNVVTETVVCLPDAVQLLTPCTIGNGFLQILDWGKFALTAYDRKTLQGIRVCLDHSRLSAFPLVHQWFDRAARTGPKPEFDAVSGEILTAAGELIVCREVTVLKALKETQAIQTGFCPDCGESYARRLGSLCPACAGQAYCAVR